MINATIAIVYHSGYGHTEKIAQHVLKGLESVSGVKAILLKAEDATQNIAQLEAVDGIIFGSPTYMGSASAVMKQFMEASSRVWMSQGWKNKLAAGFSNSGSQSGDKLSTLEQFAIFAAQQGMLWVSFSHVPGEAAPNGQPYDRIGSYLGLMTQADNDSPEVTPPEIDRLTAERFGKQFAEASLQWVRGKQVAVGV